MKLFILSEIPKYNPLFYEENFLVFMRGLHLRTSKFFSTCSTVIDQNMVMKSDYFGGNGC